MLNTMDCWLTILQVSLFTHLTTTTGTQNINSSTLI